MAYNSIQQYIEEQKTLAAKRNQQAPVEEAVPDVVNPVSRKPNATTIPLKPRPQAEELGDVPVTSPLEEAEEFVGFDIEPDLNTNSALQQLEKDLLGTQEEEPMPLSFTDYALPVIKSWEQFEPEAYYATDKERERGILTLGYGQTENVKEGDVATEEEANEYLQSQLERTAQRLEEELGEQWNVLSPAQQASVSSLAYNVDKDVVGQFKKSRAFKNLKAGDIDGFMVEAFDPEVGFVRQGGKILRGLQRRREAEKNLFLYGDEYDVASLDGNFLNA